MPGLTDTHTGTNTREHAMIYWLPTLSHLISIQVCPCQAFLKQKNSYTYLLGQNTVFFPLNSHKEKKFLREIISFSLFWNFFSKTYGLTDRNTNYFLQAECFFGGVIARIHFHTHDKCLRDLISMKNIRRTYVISEKSNEFVCVCHPWKTWNCLGF